jgi:hypothetical protein
MWKVLGKDLDLTYMYRCAAHSFNNASKDIASLPLVDPSVKDMSTLVTAMRKERVHQVSSFFNIHTLCRDV